MPETEYLNWKCRVLDLWIIIYLLWVRFNNGEAKVFDFKPLLEKSAFIPLKDIDVFKGVYIDYGIPVWNDGDIDISPEYLYENGQNERITA